jgi:hypothetical protein
MKIEIIKSHRLMIVGQKLDIDREYCLGLIKKGIAKSLEVVPEVPEVPEVVEHTLKKIK